MLMIIMTVIINGCGSTLSPRVPTVVPFVLLLMMMMLKVLMIIWWWSSYGADGGYMMMIWWWRWSYDDYQWLWFCIEPTTCPHCALCPPNEPPLFALCAEYNTLYSYHCLHFALEALCSLNIFHFFLPLCIALVTIPHICHIPTVDCHRWLIFDNMQTLTSHNDHST